MDQRIAEEHGSGQRAVSFADRDRAWLVLEFASASHARVQMYGRRSPRFSASAYCEIFGLTRTKWTLSREERSGHKLKCLAVESRHRFVVGVQVKP